MSDPNTDGMPSLDGEYRPDFETLLNHIRTGTLSELTSGDGSGLIYIDSRPKAESRVWVDPEGGIVSSFTNKFEDGFEGWQPGEVVNARFILQHSKDGSPGLLVADAYGVDVRHADTFMLPEVKAEDDILLRTLGMALIDADVEVTSPGTYRTSNMFNYEARIRRINHVQTPWDGESSPELDEQVLIQGEVVRYTPGEADYKNALFPVVQVRLANGRIVPIEMTNGRIDYEDGSLDFLYPQGLQEGDIAQINSTFGDASIWPEHQGRPATLHAASFRTAYLLQPNGERLATYETHRADIARRMANLQTLDGKAFRDTYAALMHSYTVPGENDQKWFRLLLTDREQRSLIELVDQKFPNDAEGNLSPERPLTEFDSIQQMRDVSRGYSVDVYAMSRQEFYSFCLDVANARNVADHTVDVDYPYWLLSMGNERFTDREQFAVYRQAVEHWLPYIKGKETVYKRGAPIDTERQVGVDEKYLAERSIEFLGGVAEMLPEARDYLYSLTISTLHESISKAPDTASPWGADRNIVRTLCRSLSRTVSKTGAWDATKGWLGIEDAQGLSYFVDKLPELETIVRQLETQGNSHARGVSELTDFINKLNTLPPYINPET